MSLPGDYSGNGTVAAADYVVWRKGLGTTYTQDHYNNWRAHFGQTAGSGATGSASANTTIPEPASIALLLLAAFGLFLNPRDWVAAKNCC